MNDLFTVSLYSFDSYVHPILSPIRDLSGRPPTVKKIQAQRQVLLLILAEWDINIP